MNSVKFILIHVIAPLLLGSFIYIAWRSSTLLMFGWFDEIGLTVLVENIRGFALPFAGSMPAWVIYSLPDGCWVYSFTASMVCIWGREEGVSRIFWIFIGPLIGVVGEVGQLVEIVPGTFDMSDLTVNVVAVFASLYLIKPVKEEVVA